MELMAKKAVNSELSMGVWISTRIFNGSLPAKTSVYVGFRPGHALKATDVGT
jgi:hypothetical protein